MNESRIWSVLTVIVILVVLAGTWFLGVGPRLTEAAVADAERSTVESQNAIHRVKLKALQELDANLPVLEQELSALRASVPQQADAIALLRQLEATAATFGVTLGTSSFEEAQAFVLPEALPADEQLADAMSALDNRGLVILPGSVRVTGPRGAIMGFLNALQTGQRTILVHEVSFPDGLLANDSVVEATFTFQAFMLTGQAPVVETPAEAPVAEAAG
ncbi:hypothetical protein [Homoserinimonas hongtaonis]|uniref:hypothetical protein n=1 Tax=Homoserinimonas hongtaonis TaxID=2079791 RepID=UPI000D3907FB|nr:hypothetical protein [Salinibacterium hongtaonis]AWB90005.1 hypothetical protein C2138_11040 [Salinibacterium hongtaonis]